MEFFCDVNGTLPLPSSLTVPTNVVPSDFTRNPVTDSGAVPLKSLPLVALILSAALITSWVWSHWSHTQLCHFGFYFCVHGSSSFTSAGLKYVSMLCLVFIYQNSATWLWWWVEVRSFCNRKLQCLFLDMYRYMVANHMIALPSSICVCAHVCMHACMCVFTRFSALSLGIARKQTDKPLTCKNE
jgi:hypothetical protein